MPARAIHTKEVRNARIEIGFEVSGFPLETRDRISGLHGLEGPEGQVIRDGGRDCREGENDDDDDNDEPGDGW